MTTELTKAAQQAPKIKELVEQLRNIANGVRICGVDDRRFVAGRLDEIADALTQRPAAQTEREAFEAEMRCEETWGHRSLKKRPDGRYQNWQVDVMWDVWQARASLPAAQQATPEPVGEPGQFPPMPEGWPARFRCDSCDGNGEIGELVSMGDFQPPERQTCPDCGGRGWTSEEPAFNAEHVREFAEAHARNNRPAPGVPDDATLEGIATAACKHIDDDWFSAATVCALNALHTLRDEIAAAQAKGADK